MDPVSGYLVGTGMSALANLGGGLMSAGGAAGQNAAAQQANQNAMSMSMRANDLNQWFFQKNFENQQYMSNTAYQRATADMRAAGLNPILAYQQGGANAAAGGMSSGNSVSLQNPAPANPSGEMGRAIGRTVSSALDAVRTIADIRNVEEQNNLLKANTFKTNVDAAAGKAGILKTMSETNLNRETVQNQPAVRALLKGQETSAYASAGLAGTQSKVAEQEGRRKEEWGDSAWGQIGNTVNQVLRRLGNNLRAQPQQAPSPSVGAPGARPPGLLSDDPSHWLYKKR